MINIKALSLSTASILVFASTVQAAGFYIQEQSVSGLGNAFAGQVATPRDSSIVYYNPAGMTKLSGTHAHFGSHIIAPSSNLTDTGTTLSAGVVGANNGGNPYTPTPIPNMSITHEIIPNSFWLGLSVTAPFGLANEYDDGWFGRFDSTETTLHTTDIQPSFAYRVNDQFSIGGGVNIQYADANLKKIVNPTGAAELDSRLNGDDITLGYNIGALYSPMESTTFGVHYRSAITHTLEGRATATFGGTTVSNTPSTADLGLPDIAQFGVNHSVNEKLSLQAGATWFGWNSFNEIRVISKTTGATTSVTPQNYQTTWAFALGGEYNYNDKLALRAGYQYDETPTTDAFRTTVTPDGDRQWFSTGATYKFNEKLSLDLGATYIDISSGKINVTRSLGATSSTVNANTEGDVAIFAVGLNYKF